MALVKKDADRIRELNNEFGDDAGEEEGNFGDDMEDDENEEEYLARKLRFV